MLYEHSDMQETLRNRHSAFFLALNSLFMYCTVRSITRGRPFRTIFWGLPTIFLTFTNYKHIKQQREIIRKIELDESGTHLHLHFALGFAQKVYIPHLSVLDPEQLGDFHENAMPYYASNYYPIQWSQKDKTLLLPSFGSQIDD